MNDEFTKKLREASIRLEDLKDAFIIDQMDPFLEDESLKQHLRMRIKSNQEAIDGFKQKVKGAIDKYIVEPQRGILSGQPINPFKLKKELGLE